MGKYVDAVLDKKPNEFKELVLEGIQERVRSAIEEKRVEVGKSMFEEKDEEEEMKEEEESEEEDEEEKESKSDDDDDDDDEDDD